MKIATAGEQLHTPLPPPLIFETHLAASTPASLSISTPDHLPPAWNSGKEREGSTRNTACEYQILNQGGIWEKKQEYNKGHSVKMWKMLEYLQIYQLSLLRAF